MATARPLLVLGNRNYSSWSLRAWLLLRQFGVGFDERVLALDTPGFAADIAAVSGAGRVPVLVDGPVVVWDSLAICEYANERWLAGAGWPQAAATRALARSASAEMHSGFMALRTQMPFNVRRRPDAFRWDAEADRDIARIQALWRQLRAHTDDEGRDDGPFLLGRFGIVDAMFAPVCVRFRAYGVDLDAVAADYARAMFALPAFVEWERAALAEDGVLAPYER